MAMTPEAKVKKQVTTLLKERGIYYFYPVTGGYGRSGVPDIIACYKGLFLGIECKAKGNKPTPLQVKNLEEIAACGGLAVVVDEHNVEVLGEILDQHVARSFSLTDSAG
jgi:Holliday junction resolvase